VTCPFCRCEIRSTEQIVVDPYHKTQPDKPTPLVTKYSTDEDDSGSFEVLTISSII